ncbi:hypothetical protein KKB99_08440 [bacterium]|nr:hypothetical protein [bacterium]MBU1026019.1 hypothetical protein [bacterium]
MNDDYLINLLPSEYVPKPEFRGFPLFILIVLAFVAVFIFADNVRVTNRIQNLESVKQTNEDTIKRRTPLALEALDVQARSRMLFSYGTSIWVMLHQSPPWVDVYNEIEEMVPDGMWIDSLTLAGSGEKKWPSINMVGLVAGDEWSTVIDFYSLMLDPDSKFDKVKISGYTFTKHNQRDVVMFNMRFSIKKTAFLGF